MIKKSHLLSTVVVRFSGLGLLSVVAIVLANKLGVEGYGAFTGTLAMVTIAATLAALGLPIMVTREISREYSNGRRGEWIAAALGGAFLGIFLVLIFAGLGLYLGLEQKYMLEVLVLFPIVSLIYIRQGIAIPLLGATRAIFTEQVALPTIFLILFWIYWYYASEISVHAALYCYVFAAAFSLLIGVAAFSKTELHREIWRGSAVQLGWRGQLGILRVVKGGLPFLFTQLPRILMGNADILIVVSLLGTNSGGLYAFASRISGLVALPLAIVNLSYSTSFAQLSKDENNVQLMTLARQAAGFCLFGSLLIMGVILLGFDWLMELIGSDFKAAYPLILILGLSQIVNSMLGPNGTILQMGDFELDVMKVVWTQSVLLMLLSWWAASSGSVLWVAISVLGAQIIGNLLLTYRLWQRRRFLLYPTLVLKRFKANK